MAQTRAEQGSTQAKAGPAISLPLWSPQAQVLPAQLQPPAWGTQLGLEARPSPASTPGRKGRMGVEAEGELVGGHWRLRGCTSHQVGQASGLAGLLWTRVRGLASLEPGALQGQPLHLLLVLLYGILDPGVHHGLGEHPVLGGIRHGLQGRGQQPAQGHSLCTGPSGLPKAPVWPRPHVQGALHVPALPLSSPGQGAPGRPTSPSRQSRRRAPGRLWAHRWTLSGLLWPGCPSCTPYPEDSMGVQPGGSGQRCRHCT